VIVASVCVFNGLGSPKLNYGMLVMLEKGTADFARSAVRRFVDIQYAQRGPRRGTFRVRGDMIESIPRMRIRVPIEMWGDQIDALRDRSGDRKCARGRRICRACDLSETHYVMAAGTGTRHREHQKELCGGRKNGEAGKIRRAQRVVQRTMFDIEMMRQPSDTATASRLFAHLSGRLPGEARRRCWITSADYLMFRMNPPDGRQVRGMFNGDRRASNARGLRLSNAFALATGH